MQKALILSLTLALLGSPSTVAQKIVESGKFLYQITSTTSNKTEIAGEETFKLEELDKGQRRITSNFVAKSQEMISQFDTDKLFSETITVDKDWKLLEYSLQSDTARGQLKVTVKVEGVIAKITLNVKRPDGKEQNQAREVILEDEFITTGVAAGQLIVMQKIIALKMKESKKTFLALDPTNLEKPLIEMTVERLSPVKVKSGQKIQEAQRYSIKRADTDFKLELLSDGSGTLWGFTGDSPTSRLLVYRQNLFPQGFEVLK